MGSLKSEQKRTGGGSPSICVRSLGGWGGEEGVLVNKHRRKRGREGQNLGILNKRTFWMSPFGLLKNLLQTWSVFICVSLECSPINGSLKYRFWNFFHTYKYDLTIWSIILRGYWFFWRIFLRSLRFLSKPVQELVILYIRSTNVLIKHSL